MMCVAVAVIFRVKVDVAINLSVSVSVTVKNSEMVVLGANWTVSVLVTVTVGLYGLSLRDGLLFLEITVEDELILLEPRRKMLLKKNEKKLVGC